jgi:hypothetical protein
MLSKYGKNYLSALTSLAPGGTISAFKLIEISTAIQMQFTEQTKSYILSQLQARSPQGLSGLNYSLLFESSL